MSFLFTGHVYPEISGRGLHEQQPSPPVVYRNTGNGKFENVAPRPGLVLFNLIPAAAVLLEIPDNDGDVEHHCYQHERASVLLRNDCTSGYNSIEGECIGVKSNRSALERASKS